MGVQKGYPISYRSASTARSRFWKSKGKAPSCRGSATHCRSHAPVRASLRGGRQRRARDRGAGGLERDALDDGAVRGRRLILKSNHSFCLKPVRTQPISQPKKYTSPLAIAAPAMPIPSAQDTDPGAMRRDRFCKPQVYRGPCCHFVDWYRCASRLSEAAKAD